MPFCCSSGEADGGPPKSPAKDKPFVILHTHAALYWWDLLIILVILASLIIVPLRIGFDLTDDGDWLAPDLVMDFLLITDIIMTFFRTYEIEGELQTNRADIAKRYLKGRFVVDAVSTAPISYIALAASATHPAYRVNRMLRLGKLADFFLKWERNSNLKPSVIGIIKIVFVVLYMAHFVGCAFHGLTLLVNSTTFTSTVGFAQRSFWSRYFRSFYWALVSLTGYNASVPVHWAEVSTAVAVTIISIALFGTVVGIFGSLVTTLDSSKLYFRQKMEAIDDYMSYKKIPDVLQNEVKDYYDYMWKSGKALEANEAIDALPANLKQRMSFQTCYMSIRGVPFFKDVKDNMVFMGDVVKVLRPRIGLPNSYLVKKDEVGAEMYFVSRGELNVVNDRKVVFTLKDGMFFGEIALIYKMKRTATIVARTFCDLYVLTKDDFSKVMRKYPEESKGIKTVAKARFDDLQKAAEAAAAKAREEAERVAREREQAEIAERANIGEQVASEQDDDDEEEMQPVGRAANNNDDNNGDDDSDDELLGPSEDAPGHAARPQTSEQTRRTRRYTASPQPAASSSPQASSPVMAVQPTQEEESPRGSPTSHSASSR